jgi:RHS repeat-associated protein
VLSDEALDHRDFEFNNLDQVGEPRRTRLLLSRHSVNYDSYTGAGTRTYDAENRMTQAWGGNNQWQIYTYSADGQRVRRKVDGLESWQIYGFEGELLAEYQAHGLPTAPEKEYGYRNGQLLVETKATAGSWGSPPSFTAPNPLVAGVTEVQALHITELRTAINALRGHRGLPAFSWQQPAGPGDWIKAEPILEMRTALDQALGAPSPAYSGGLAQGLLIKKDHIQELRDRVLAAWNSSSGGTDIRWLVADHLGTPRMIIDQTGSLAGVTRHDYLPFGEELIAGQGGRTIQQGYSGDNIRQKFTQKERDNETGLDYFGARYYASTQGRFTGADAFFKDSNVNDPQSWNKYAYVRNNPLKYLDELGEKATVTIVTDEKNKKGTITIDATIAVYAMAGSNLSAEAVNNAANTIEQSIEKAWSGTYVQKGITYTVTTNITTSVASDEASGENSGAQNVIGLWNGPVAHDADSVVRPGKIFGGADSGQWNVNNLGNGVAAHEFTHLLGVDDRKGGPYLSNTRLLSDSRVPRSATAYDYGWALGGAINSHETESKSYISSPNSWETRSSCCAPRLSEPKNHRSTRELKAGRIWWN